MYSAPLTVPGEFLGSPELPPSAFLRKIDEAVAGFAIPLPHHVWDSPPTQLPSALRTCKYMFVREDSSTPSLAPLYRGPYLILERRDKFFRLQIGSRADSVSVDRLKPVFSEEPIVPALPPARGRPPSRPRNLRAAPFSPPHAPLSPDATPIQEVSPAPPPVLRPRGRRVTRVPPHLSVPPLPPPPDVWPPLASPPARKRMRKKIVRFNLKICRIPDVAPRRNPLRSVRRKLVSALAPPPPFLLGGILWRF